MNDLVSRIDDFISKQVKFRSRAEAEQYHVRGLPPEQQKIPKSPKMPKLPRTGLPSRTRTIQPGRKLPTGIGEEVARQLTPKPGYHSPEDIAYDIAESKRLARKITEIKKPDSKEGVK